MKDFNVDLPPFVEKIIGFLVFLAAIVFIVLVLGTTYVSITDNWDKIKDWTNNTIHSSAFIWAVLGTSFVFFLTWIIRDTVREELEKHKED